MRNGRQRTESSLVHGAFILTLYGRHPEKYARQIDGIKLIVMGGVKKGGSGCICPESVLLRTLVTHMVLLRDEVVVMDMEAGVEHLGRATAQGVDRLIIVVEPGRRSIERRARRRLASKST
jgi:CO dehydrogenase maturation factor